MFEIGTISCTKDSKYFPNDNVFLPIICHKTEILFTRKNEEDTHFILFWTYNAVKAATKPKMIPGVLAIATGQSRFSLNNP